MAVETVKGATPSRSFRLSNRSRSHRGRLGTGVAVSVLLHASPLILAGVYWANRPPVVQPPDAVFEIELFRLQALPKPPSEHPPGPKQVEAVKEARPRAPIQPRIQTPQPPTDVEPLAMPSTPPSITRPLQATPAPETTAPPKLSAPPAANASSATDTWQGRLLAHLERLKRYPPEARARRLQGVAYVRLAMDREGRVLSSVIERSSGQPAFDREALALLQRAQPLPKPPAEISGDRITLSVPVEFFMRGR